MHQVRHPRRGLWGYTHSYKCVWVDTHRSDFWGPVSAKIYITIDWERRALFPWSAQILNNLAVFIHHIRWVRVLVWWVTFTMNSLTLFVHQVLCGPLHLIALSVKKYLVKSCFIKDINNRRELFPEWYHYAINKINSSVDLTIFTIHKVKKITKTYLLSI